MFLNSHSLSYLFTGLRAGAVILAAREAHDLSALTRYMHTRGAGCPPLRDGREMGREGVGQKQETGDNIREFPLPGKEICVVVF